mgnify:CR=1 FL=1
MVENTKVNFKGNSCFTYNTLVEDHQSQSKSTKDFQYFSTIGKICRHPFNKSIAIQVEVSHRSDVKEMPKEIKAVAGQFLETFELVDN